LPKNYPCFAEKRLQVAHRPPCFRAARLRSGYPLVSPAMQSDNANIALPAGSLSMKSRGFSLVELLVILILAAVLLGLFWLQGFGRRSHHGGTWPHHGRPFDNHARLRGIHQNLIVYAHGNNGYYPGFDSSGQEVDLTVEARFQVLLDNQFLTAEYVISPQEMLTPWTPGTALTSDNYSYAMLQVAGSAARGEEWRDTINSHAPILTDRNIGPDAHANAQSIWAPAPGQWLGCVAWNDNHVTFEATHIMSETQYGSSPQWRNDNLFLNGDAGPAGDDAYMIHSGR